MREHPALRVFVTEMCKRFPALWDNGTFGNRPMRGSTTELSVHATGRACDLSYRYMKTKGIKEGGRKQAMKACEYLVRNADAFGLEMILDYFPMPHGRGWRCDTGAWKVYLKPTIHGAPMGDWLHCEIDGKLTAEQMKAAFEAAPVGAA